MTMNNYCYECEQPTDDEICNGCNKGTFPLFPRREAGRSAPRRVRSPEGVLATLVPHPEGQMDRLFYCELEVAVPSHWDSHTVLRLGQEVDRILDGPTARSSWRCRGGTRSVIRISGMRTRGRCDWCVAFRKSLQNLAKEKDEPFYTDCRCRPL